MDGNGSLGILGLGSRTTLFYVACLNKRYHQLKGGYSTCPFTLVNVNFDRINNVLPHRSQELDTLMREALEQLRAAGVGRMVVPNITLHETLDHICPNDTTIVHPVHTTLARLKKDGVDGAFIFGSLHTMKAPYLHDLFSNQGIRLYQPLVEDMKFLDGMRKAVYNGLENDRLRKAYEDVIRTYTKDRPIVIACTELSIPLQKTDSQIYDMVDIQIEEAMWGIDRTRC